MQVMDKLAALDADLRDKKARKARLESEVALCRVKLERAHKLISGLGGEKARWTAAAASLGEQFVRLTGDVLLAAGQIAYLGPFTAAYRQVCGPMSSTGHRALFYLQSTIDVHAIRRQQRPAWASSCK
jgi:hypothetical protein